MRRRPDNNSVRYWLKQTDAPRRSKPYSYRDGTMTVRCSPKKLATFVEMMLCAKLAKHLTIKHIAQLMECSTPVVSRAIRAYYFLSPEKEKR